jgi:outer membrane protein assembly factor BamB
VSKRFLSRSMTLYCACVVLSSSVALAQGSAKGDWSMSGADAGQSGWQKAETKLTKDDIAGSFKFLWKIKLGQPLKDAQTFSEPLLASRLINAQGFKDIVYWGTSDTLYAVDSELGNLLWQKHFDISSSQASAGCASPNLGLAIEPPLVINFNARRAPGSAPPPQAGPVAVNERRLGGAAGGGGFGLKGIYALTSDGNLHEQVLTTGADFAPSVKFLPSPNGSPYGLVILGKTIFTTTGHGCGSVPNGAWSINIGTPAYAVSNYSTGKVSPLNLTGPAVASDGTSFIVTGSGSSDASVHANSVVALTANEMKVKDWYSPVGGIGDIEHVTPITFSHKGKELVVAPGKDGSFVLLDASSLGGSDHHTPLSTTASFSKHGERHTWDGLSSWQDKDGVRWVMASISAGVATKENTLKTNGATAHGAVIAFKVENAEDADQKPVLTPVWISRDMVNPASPVIANGVVVVLSSGNATTHATLYVLDAATGMELYSSKDAIPTYAHFSGVSVGDGHAFFTDHDGTLYSFGIAMEH